MAHGGSRPGAGRTKGAAATKTREIADRAAADGITPLEVMLQTMRELWAANDKLGACEKAKDAAPYMHARFNNVTAKHDISDSLGDLLKAVDGRTRGIPASG